MFPKLFGAFIRAQGGNFAIITAVCATALFGAAGAALDYSRIAEARTSAQAITDSMALSTAEALAAGMSAAEAKKVGREFYLANRNLVDMEDGLVPDIRIKKQGGALRVAATISGKTNTSLLGVLGIDQLRWKTKATIGLQFGDVEVALVLDTSLSMILGSDKMTPMKQAASQFVDAVLAPGDDDAKRLVSLVPYGESVNFGDDFSGWLSSGASQGGSARPGSAFVGCFRPEPYDQLSRHGLGSVHPGKYEPLVPVHYGGKYPTCPSRKSEALFFQTDAAALKRRIANLDVSFGTATDVAMAWAWRTYLPNWRARMRKVQDKETKKALKLSARNQHTRKIIVLLTDGQIIRMDSNGDGRGNWLFKQERRAPQNAFAQICEGIRKQGDVDVYVIGYEYGGDGRNERLLKNCVSGDGRYFSGNKANIGEIFEFISGKASRIYLSS